MRSTSSHKLYPYGSTADFEEDDPSQFIVIDDDTDDSSDADDLSEVSMVSAGGIGKQEFQALLLMLQHSTSDGGFVGRPGLEVEDMSVGQVEEAAVRVGFRVRVKCEA